VARLLLWHGEQGGTPGAMGSVEKAVWISSPHPHPLLILRGRCGWCRGRSWTWGTCGWGWSIRH